MIVVGRQLFVDFKKFKVVDFLPRDAMLARYELFRFFKGRCHGNQLK